MRLEVAGWRLMFCSRLKESLKRRLEGRYIDHDEALPLLPVQETEVMWLVSLSIVEQTAKWLDESVCICSCNGEEAVRGACGKT